MHPSSQSDDFAIAFISCRESVAPMRRFCERIEFDLFGV